MLLADMGARVIKVEQPERGDDTRAWGPPFLGGESSYFLSVNRNKESLTLDFKAPAGRAVLDTLVGARRRAGRELPAWNARPSRAGLRRHWRQAPSAAHLRVAIGLRPHRPARRRAGLRRGAPGRRRTDEHHRTGRRPRLSLGVAVADIVTGMFAAQGVLLALLARQQTRPRTARGRRHARLGGRAADLSGRNRLCHRHLAGPHGQPASVHRALRHVRDRATARWCWPSATTTSGQRFCRVAGLEALEADARFATNAGSRAALRRARAVDPPGAGGRHPCRMDRTLVAAGVPCGPVRTVDEALADAQLAARGMIERLAHPTAGDICGARRADQAVGDAGGRARRRRRRWASTPTRC